MFVDVSMPYSGLLPFLHMWQGFLYMGPYGVNALQRASSISTKKREMETLFYDDVSMPYSGLLPFLLKTKKSCKKDIPCVNALQRASSISTRRPKKEV